MKSVWHSKYLAELGRSYYVPTFHTSKENMFYCLSPAFFLILFTVIKPCISTHVGWCFSSRRKWTYLLHFSGTKKKLLHSHIPDSTTARNAAAFRLSMAAQFPDPWWRILSYSIGPGHWGTQALLFKSVWIIYANFQFYNNFSSYLCCHLVPIPLLSLMISWFCMIGTIVWLNRSVLFVSMWVQHARIPLLECSCEL